MCESCGTELRPNSKFCDECGAAVATATTPAEYKQVTILFADVARSMDIAAAVDIERLRDIMTELVQRCCGGGAAATAGTVEYTGNRVMAIFGAQLRWRITPFEAVLRPWRFRRRRTGWRPRCSAAMAWHCGCGWV